MSVEISLLDIIAALQFQKQLKTYQTIYKSVKNTNGQHKESQKK